MTLFVGVHGQSDRLDGTIENLLANPSKKSSNPKVDCKLSMIEINIYQLILYRIVGVAARREL